VKGFVKGFVEGFVKGFVSESAGFVCRNPKGVPASGSRSFNCARGVRHMGSRVITVVVFSLLPAG